MKRPRGKSHCPVNFALEVFGDPWTLLIVRDIVMWGRHSYHEFASSSEGIATNVLAARLEQMKNDGLLHQEASQNDRRQTRYYLTEKGLDLIPPMLEMATWSSRYDDQTIAPPEFVRAVVDDRSKMYESIKAHVRNNGAVLDGDDPFIKYITK